MRIDDENKVVVPDFVADYIEYAKKEEFDCQLAFVEIPEHDEWLPKNIYSWLYDNSQEENDNRFFNCIKAWIEGYEATETRYYWRKKREHLAWFEKIEDSYLIRFKFFGEVDYYYTLGEVGSAPIEMTETEARDLLKDDFDKFEKVECE